MSTAKRPSKENQVAGEFAKHAARAMVHLRDIDLKHTYSVEEIFAYFSPTRLSGFDLQCLQEAFSNKKFRKCVAKAFPVDWIVTRHQKGGGSGRVYGIKFAIIPEAIVDETAMKERLL